LSIKDLSTDLSDKDLGTKSYVDKGKIIVACCKSIQMTQRKVDSSFDTACVYLLETVIQEFDKNLSSLQIIFFQQLPKHV